jgi:hypothetical protein
MSGSLRSCGIEHLYALYSMPLFIGPAPMPAPLLFDERIPGLSTFSGSAKNTKRGFMVAPTKLEPVRIMHTAASRAVNEEVSEFRRQ